MQRRHAAPTCSAVVFTHLPSFSQGHQCEQHDFSEVSELLGCFLILFFISTAVSWALKKKRKMMVGTA
jgi:hypothetical protein